MTEPNEPGNMDMPDFKELDDRVIAKPGTGPFLVIKTNLDPKDPAEENPYFQDKAENEIDLLEYFEDK